MKTLHTIQKYNFDDKFIFGVYFFCHRIFNALLMSLKKILDENQKIHLFNEIHDYWLRTSAVIHVYEATARSDEYRMIISVYKL